MPKSFPFYKQHDAMDCGATCLRMISRHYGRFYSLEYLRDITYIAKDGVSLMDIAAGAEKIGFNTLAAKVDWDRLEKGLPLPLVAHWRQQHFIVVYEVDSKYVHVADPASGKFKITKEDFLDGWASTLRDGQQQGVILLFETTPNFYEREGVKQNRSGFGHLFSYLRQYRPLLWQIFIGLIAGSLLQLAFPFLTQAVVDIGINTKDLGFIKLILIGQIILFLSSTSVDFIRGWILMHLGMRLNISLISDFLIKLMKLPPRFFDTKQTGDLLQRIADNQRVEQFLTSSILSSGFAVINFIVFSIVLLIYNSTIFLVYLLFTVLYMAWIIVFLKRRKELDYKRFDKMSENQSTLIQLISGVNEIKLHNAERQKRWEWERTQAKLYRVSINYLALRQWQHAGTSFLNELKNIIVTFIAAQAVTEGKMSIGVMLSIQYIIGQLNSPLEQFVQLIQMGQDAKISLERLNEIHEKDDEDTGAANKLTILPEGKDLYLENISFQYGGAHTAFALKNVNLKIAAGKTLAIVGSSGSGKTTLLKLLLNFYAPTQGRILLSDVNLANIVPSIWRDKCGVVMQEGFVFNDTIANNIALGDTSINRKKLLQAVRVANIQSYVESLPLGYNTKIGADGVGLSQGQKQRLLIARAVYKNPEYIFFDEATNALDSTNEKQILNNLDEFFTGKTVVVVAHRLSTVRNADKIVVLEQGQIVEMGTHNELSSFRGVYYGLVKNQLELGV